MSFLKRNLLELFLLIGAALIMVMLSGCTFGIDMAANVAWGLIKSEQQQQQEPRP